MFKWLKNCYEAAVLWIDWHGRITTIVAIIVAIGGAALVNRVVAVWGEVHGVYLWIVSGLAFAVFLATIALIGRRMESHSREARSDGIADQRSLASQQDNRDPRLIVYAHRYLDVALEHDTGIWKESNPQDGYKRKSLIFQIRNDVHDDKSGIPADGLRAQLIWKYANGNPGPNLSPVPWLDEPLGIIDIPVGATARLLVGTKNQNYWDGWANLRTSGSARPANENDMLPHHGILLMRMIGGKNNKVWFEAHLSWKIHPAYNHPEFCQITEAEAKQSTN